MTFKIYIPNLIENPLIYSYTFKLAFNLSINYIIGVWIHEIIVKNLIEPFIYKIYQIHK